jgi:hypothetical protein
LRPDARPSANQAAQGDGQPAGTKQKVDKKLDEALEASFPERDPVSFTEPAPVTEKDRSWPEVKLADQQAPQKAALARKTK